MAWTLMEPQRLKVVANYWVENYANGWRIAYRNECISLYYCVGNMWTPESIGAKIFSSRDAAMLKLSSLIDKMENKSWNLP